MRSRNIYRQSAMRYNRAMGKCLAWAFMLLALAATSAAAQAKPDFEAAKRHYLAGKEAMNAGDHDAAVREYILAYDITKDPSLFRQIGLAYEAAGKKIEAAVYYRRYLAEAKPGADTDDVRARLTAIEGPKPEPTPPPEPPPLPPPGPAHQASDAERAPLAPPPLPTLSETENPWQRTAGWIFVGLAAAGATTGAVLVTSAKGREEDIQRLVDFRDPASGQPYAYTGSTKTDYENKISEGENLSNWATIAFIGAGVCAGAATMFFVLDATRSSGPEKVSIAPFAAPGTAGLVAGWGF
jgi:hypothetical protein